MELRLRFPGTDLWSGHKALQSEVSLMFLLLGAVYVHHLPQLLTQLGFDPLLLNTKTPVHILATVAVLMLPGAAAAATDGLMRLVAGELLLMVASGVALCCDTQCCTMLCCAVLRCVVLCCAMLCRAVPCSAVLCCAVLCCAALCCTDSPVLQHDVPSVTVLCCRKGNGVMYWPCSWYTASYSLSKGLTASVNAACNAATACSV